MPDTNYINSRFTLGRLPITLICDNIRDPGNMGTIIRTASAVGCSKVLAMKGKIENVDEITQYIFNKEIKRIPAMPAHVKIVSIVGQTISYSTHAKQISLLILQIITLDQTFRSEHYIWDMHTHPKTLGLTFDPKL